MSNYLTYLLNEHIQGVFTFLFFENNYDHRWNCCSIFSLYELVQYALLNYFFRRIIVTILACFLTSFLHENNWHVLRNVFSIKTKITNWAIIYLIFWINKFKVFSHFFFFENNHDHRQSCCSIFSLYELVQYALWNWIFRKNHIHNLCMFFDILSSWK